MTIQDLYNQYRVDPELKDSSKSEYKPRIEKYLNLYTDIAEALDEKNLWDFIKNSPNPRGYYNSLRSFYLFIERKINKNKKAFFPIDLVDVELLHNKEETSDNSAVFIDKPYSLDVLFDDKYYNHLNSKEASPNKQSIFSLLMLRAKARHPNNP